MFRWLYASTLSHFLPSSFPATLPQVYSIALVLKYLGIPHWNSGTKLHKHNLLLRKRQKYCANLIYLLHVPVQPQPSQLLHAKIASYFFRYEDSSQKEGVLGVGLLEQRVKVRSEKVHDTRVHLCMLHGRGRMSRVMTFS